MNIQPYSSRRKGPGGSLLGLFAFLLLLTLSACGSNNSVQIYDNAHVLNSSRVQNAASNLSNPIAIYTTNTFRGTQADFQRTAIQKLNGNSDMIVMAIDTSNRYLYIARGSNVPLSGSGINQAVNAFSTNFRNGDYTNASTAALSSMQNSISSTNQSRGGSSVNPLIACLIIPLLIILGVAFFAMSRRRRMGALMNRGAGWSATPNPPPNTGPYYDPNQGYGPYNQGYGAPNQRGGMNPWAAGGLGAAAGGLAGYELGKMAGEREGDRSDYGGNEAAGGGGFFGGDAGGGFDNSGNVGGGGNFGGDAGGGGFFGGGGGNEGFGGGNEGSGGGGNFGGDAGGGGFFGGGGGNDDFSGGGGFGGDSGGGSNF